MRSAVSLTVVSEWWYVIYILLIREMNDKTRKLQLRVRPGSTSFPRFLLRDRLARSLGTKLDWGNTRAKSSETVPILIADLPHPKVSQVPTFTLGSRETKYNKLLFQGNNAKSEASTTRSPGNHDPGVKLG